MNPIYSVTPTDPRVIQGIQRLQNMGAPARVTVRTQIGMFNSGPIYTVIFWKDEATILTADDLHDGEAPQGGYECIAGWLTTPIGVNIAFAEMKSLGGYIKG